MATPTNHWKLGLFVVIGLVVALATVVYFGAESLRKDHVSYTTYFDESVQGLDTGAPVFFRGVRVGQVSEIGVAPDGRHVAVTLALFTKNLRRLGLGEGRGSATRIAVPSDLRVQLASQGITGVKAVQLDFFDEKYNPPPVLSFEPPEKYIPSAKSTFERLEASVVHAFDRFPQVADAMLDVASRTNRILDEFEQAHLPRQMQASLAELDQTLAAFRRAIGEAKVGEVSAQARASMAGLDKTVQRLDAVLARIDGERGLIASAQRATDAVGDAAANAPAITDELSVTLREIQEAAESFRKLTEALERDPDMLLRGRRE
jgi:phospholipid/cholesterol/gamma-HCH transport system substrate-binding protein